MLRFHQVIAALILVLWTPAVSHCLLEEVLSPGGHGCCQSDGDNAPDHSQCDTCLSVEKSQVRNTHVLLASPRLIELKQNALPAPSVSLAMLMQTCRYGDEPGWSPPVPPAELILQKLIAHPVRGPSLVG